MISPPDIRVYDFNDSDHDRPRLSTRSSLSASIPVSRTPASMPIPNAREEAPPPLPPPPILDEIDIANDLGGQWSNDFGRSFGKTGLPTINPSSSLCVGRDRRLHDIGDEVEDSRRRSSAATIRSSPDMDSRWEGFRHKDEGYHSLSGSGIANQSVDTPCSHHPSSSLLLAHARLSMLALYVHSLGRGHEHTYPPFPQVSLWLFCETDRRQTCCLDYMAKDHWNGETFKAPPTPTTNNSCPGLGDPTHHRGQCLSVAWAKKLRRRVVYLSPSREHIHTRQNPCPPRTVRRTQCPGG